MEESDFIDTVRYQKINVFRLKPDEYIETKETIKVEINIDKADLLETIDFLDKSVVRLQNQLPLFVQPIKQANSILKINFTPTKSPDILEDLPLSLPALQFYPEKTCPKEKSCPKELKKRIKSQPGPIVRCYMVPESLQHFARKQGYRFEIVETKKRKRSLPYAETDWFYSHSVTSLSNSTFPARKRPKMNLSECKAMLVKAHHLKALRMQSSRSFRKSENLFDVEYIADFKVIKVGISI